MSEKRVDPDTKPPFNYIVCLDIVVLACILVVAGRPDGLAITLSAIIVAVAAVCYRCSMSVKASVSGRSRKADSGVQKDNRKLSPATRPAPVESAAESSGQTRSWLRESD